MRVKLTEISAGCGKWGKERNKDGAEIFPWSTWKDAVVWHGGNLRAGFARVMFILRGHLIDNWKAGYTHMEVRRGVPTGDVKMYSQCKVMTTDKEKKRIKQVGR